MAIESQSRLLNYTGNSKSYMFYLINIYWDSLCMLSVPGPVRPNHLYLTTLLFCLTYSWPAGVH